MTDKELQKSVIDDFWGWIGKHKDDVCVQFYNEKECWLYLAHNREILDSFTHEFQVFCEEGGCPAAIMMNCICIELSEILGGYGFTMQEAWDMRPAGIENELGENIL